MAFYFYTIIRTLSTFSEETNTTESVSFSIYFLFLDNVDNSVSIVGTINLISKTLLLLLIPQYNYFLKL